MIINFWVSSYRLFLVFFGLVFYQNSYAQLPDQFQKVDLLQGLTNATNFEFAPDGRIFIVDRYGELLIYDPETQISTSAGTVPVFHDLEDGLLGIEFDPHFLSNNYIYLHYSPVTPSVNRVSRFTMSGNTLNLGSEVVLLEWPTQREICCHAAGDLAFDSQGNLYIATGDNTNHSDYATLDESDINASSENTSSNTDDLRGKILRITPQPDGSYTVPGGNLFPGGTGGREEIYVMGARNPYRIFVDKENTDWLFWGEVGPDANTAGPEGPEGLDEINLTRQAGNYGWPYFSGENRPYRNDYASQPFYYEASAPVNLSQWNTGAANLPAAQPSWLSFFHECYLAGTRYYYDPSILDAKKLPIEFDQAFFYFDFNSSRIWVVQMDAQGNIQSNQRLAPAIFNINKNGYIDMKTGPDGHLYILAYGEGCCPDNVGSGKLVRVDYTGIVSNSSPVVNLSADPTSGSLPLAVDFSSQGTFDPDGDPLSYQWDFESDGTVDSNQENPSHTYNAAGTYNVLLKVSDDQGGISTNNITIHAGNNAAEFTFISPPDGGLIGWDDDIQVEVSATDVEDGVVDCGDINLVPSIGHLNHFHDDLTSDGCAHSLRLDPLDHNIQGEMNIFYVLGVNYTDQGGLTSFDQVRLHPKRKEAEFYDSQQDVAVIGNTDAWGGGTSAIRVNHGSYMVFEGRNLSGINSVRYRAASAGPGGSIELRMDSPTGTLLSSANITNTGSWDQWVDVTAAVTDPGGKHDLYFVFTNPGNTDLFSLNWIEFGGNGISLDNTPPEVEAVTAAGPSSIEIEFSEPVTQNTAENLSNYQLNGGISLVSAQLQPDQRTVLLSVTAMVPGQNYQLTISGVQNQSGLSLVSASYPLSLFEEIRINAGGPQVTLNGITFEEDQYASSGELYDNAVSIAGTTNDVLYQTERWGNHSYNIPVSNSGLFDIRLHFAEIYFGTQVAGNVGDRIFTVNIEGNPVLTDFDMLSEAAPATALVKEFDDVAVNDGVVNIQFIGQVENPKVSAIEILDPGTISDTPGITILSPQNGASVNQPFSIGFSVTNWEVAPGSSHVHYFIDGQMIGPYYSLDPITIDGLGLGTHTIRLELFAANHSATGIFDEVTVNVTEQVVCLETDFPDQWTEHLIDEALPYRSVYILPQQDLDGDGLKDIVTGGWWYKNPGSAGGNWEQRTIGSPFNNVAWIHDFDGDGDQDLFGSQGAYESSDLAWAQNDGNGNFTVHTNIPSGTTSFEEIFIAGIAGGVYQTGGPYQLAIAWNGAEEDNSQIQIITVPADPVNTSWTIDNLHPTSLGEALTAGDIDGDGDLDLFQTENWLRNDQDSWTLFNTGITYTSHVDRNALADFDRDGDLDGVAGQLLNNREIAWFEAPDDPTQLWTKHQIYHSIDGSLSVGVADMDSDGDQDIVVGEWKVDHKLFGFENDLCNSGGWITHTIDQGGNGLDHHDGSQLVDIDNDGDLDVITIGWDNITPRIFENLTEDGGGPVTSSDEAWLEAECGTVGSGWSSVSHGSASGGTFLLSPDGNNYDNGPTDPSAIISFNFSLNEAGSYKVFCRVTIPDEEGDSFWVRANGGTWIKWNQVPGNSGFSWHQVFDSDNRKRLVNFELLAGANTLEIGHREDGAGIDKIYVTQTGAKPGGEGAAATNCAAGGSQLPIISAGQDVELILPNSEVVLNSSASDPDGGSIVDYQWSQQSGPATADLSGQTTATLTASGLVAAGAYVFGLTVTDDEGESAYDEVTVTVSEVGFDEAWLEAECGIVGSGWAAVNHSGASGGIFLNSPAGNYYDSGPTDPSAILSYHFTLSEAGSYKVFCRVTTPDEEGDSFWVRANGGNWVKWNQVPGNSGFSWHQLYDSDNRKRLVTFDLSAGANTIEVGHREDGAGIDKIYITQDGSTPAGTGSAAANCSGSGSQPPIANAGSDQGITLPDNSVVLNGSGIDPDGGSIVNYLWSLQSPGNPTLSGQTTASLTASNLTEGVHTFRLTVTDDEGETAFDEVNVAVSAANATEAWLEAECGVVGSNWTVVNNGSASGGSYLLSPAGTLYDTGPVDANSILSYTFSLSEGGSYKVFCRVTTPDEEGDSFWIRANGGNWVKWNQIPGNSGFSWHQLYDSDNRKRLVTFNLSSGVNTLEVGHREDGAGIDKIYITRDGGQPAGAGQAAANCEGQPQASILQDQDIFNAHQNKHSEDILPHFTVYPNPTGRFFTVVLFTDRQELINLELVDAIGRIQQLGQVAAGTGYTELEIDTYNLNIRPGAYYLRANSSQFRDQYFRLMITP